MILFESKSECCGCGACANKCPKEAIRMIEDEYGFIYPEIDNKKCIECGICNKVCDLKRKEESDLNSKSKCYFALSKNKDILMNSTSGGVFSLIARKFIERGGEVYGCALRYNSKGEFDVCHINIEEKEKLNLILGSKYVQSNAEIVFKDIKESLNDGKKILFSGTPCQISGLKNFLGKDYPSLYTVDLVCHGTPSRKMFNDFIKCLNKKYKKNIVNVNFRKKLKKISPNVFFYFEMIFSDGKIKKSFCKLLSYYGLFLDGDIYRESCYKCKYANPNRKSDITLGDGWGIEKTKPNILIQNGGNIDNFYGCNSVMLNSEKGIKLFNMISSDVISYNVEFEDISLYNHQLCQSSTKNKYYNTIMELYRKYGYKGVDEFYFKKIGKKNLFKYKIYYPISRKIPLKLKEIIKGKNRRD